MLSHELHTEKVPALGGSIGRLMALVPLVIASILIVVGGGFFRDEVQTSNIVYSVGWEVKLWSRVAFTMCLHVKQPFLYDGGGEVKCVAG